MTPAATSNPASETKRDARERREGVVVTDARNKTIKVRVSYSIRFPKYEKVIRRSTFLHAHDENNEAKTGDQVEVMACRRLSKSKCWRLERIVRKAD